MNYFDSFEILSKMSSQHGQLNQLPKHFYILDTNGNALWVNDTFNMFLGTDNSLDLTSQFNTYDLLPGHEADKVKENNENVLIHQKDLIFSEKFTYANHQTKTAISFKTPFKDSKRNLKGVIGMSFVKNDEILQEKINLSQKKINCLYLLAKGYTYPEIASQLHLSPRTIEHYIEDLYERFECDKRSQLIAHAMKIDDIKMRILNEM